VRARRLTPRPTGRPESLTLDSGALIALERADGRVRALLRLAHERRTPIAVPATVVAQVWRGTARQSPIAALLNAPNVTVHALDDQTARAAGMLCGRTGTSDVVDAHVVLIARLTRSAVITSDPADLAALDPDLTVHRL